MGDQNRQGLRHHRFASDARSSGFACVVPGLQQNNNTHRLLAGIVLHYSADPHMRIAVDQEVRLVLIQIVVHGRYDAYMLDPRLVLVVLDGELALAGTTDGTE